MTPDTPVMHTMDHTEIGISSAGGGRRQGQLNAATRIFWKSFKIHLVEVYLIKIIFLMVDTGGGGSGRI